MPRWPQIKPTLRGPLAGAAFLAIVALASLLWLRSPGLDVRDGRHDRARNGIALGSAWIAGDSPPSTLGTLTGPIREHHLAEIYLQLPPPGADGLLTGIDSTRIEALLYECSDARGWAQLSLAQLPYDDIRWRRFFIVELRRLLDRQPRLRGIQLDLSRTPEVSPALLALLDELRPVLAPDTRLLSIAAAAWKEPSFREVARRADQLVIPLDIPASAFARFSVNRTIGRIGNSLAWSEGKPTLFRLPAEQRLARALRTLHLGLSTQPVPDQYQGIILDATPAPDSAAWAELRAHFLRP